MRTPVIQTVVVCLSFAAVAQAQLKVRNSGEDTIVIKYLPLSQHGQKMKEHAVRGNSSATIRLTGQDPYLVSYHVQGEDNNIGFHAKASAPVRLKQLAGRGEVFDIRAYQAAKRVNGRMLAQVTVGSLTDSNGNQFGMIRDPSNASQFVQNVVNSRWSTRYRAINGNNVDATVDFKNLRYGEQGSFTDVLISEDNNNCYICARWSFGTFRGDVFFTISKNAPNRIDGSYLTDGGQDRLSWSGSR